ncbi:MAG: orotate phosphoribosyltransferase [Phycisphaerae bacterium]|nr:orotate phosphoribosyltransferase [Phycisphaerae bacterium]
MASNPHESSAAADERAAAASGAASRIDRAALARRIADASLLRGSFTLRSGRTSSFYLDKYLFSTRPEILRDLGVLFAARIPAGTTRLAGAELGGIPLVSATSLASGLPCVFVRNAKKDYGTAKQLEGAVNKGDRIVLVEDVATTGGQALEAAKVLVDAGAVVTHVIATIDRLEGARENVENAGICFDSIFTVRDLGIDAS